MSFSWDMGEPLANYARPSARYRDRDRRLSWGIRHRAAPGDSVDASAWYPQIENSWRKPV